MSRPNSGSACPTGAACSACTNVIHDAASDTAMRNATNSAPIFNTRGTTCDTSSGGWFTRWMNSAGIVPWRPVARRMFPPRMAYATRPPATNSATRHQSDVMNTVVYPTCRNQSQSVANVDSQGTTTSTRKIRTTMAMISRRTSRRIGGTTRRPGPSKGRVMAP